MKFKDQTLSGILRSLAADEYLAWMQYYFGKVIAQGKQLNFLNKILETNGKDELDDHFNKLVTWMQSKNIPVETDYNVMQEICNTKYDIGFKDPSDTRAILEHQIKAEEEAIEAYSQAMIEPEIVKYPDLVIILGEICNDEREHLKDLNDINSSIVTKDFSENRNFEKVDVFGNWIYEFIENKINELSNDLTKIQENIDELTEMSNLDWELDSSVDRFNLLKLGKINNYCEKNDYIKIQFDEDSDNVIWYSNEVIIIKINDMLYVFRLKGTIVNEKLSDLVDSMNGVKNIVNNFSMRLNKVFGLLVNHNKMIAEGTWMDLIEDDSEFRSEAPEINVAINETGGKVISDEYNKYARPLINRALDELSITKKNVSFEGKIYDFPCKVIARRFERPEILVSRDNYNKLKFRLNKILVEIKY